MTCINVTIVIIHVAIVILDLGARIWMRDLCLFVAGIELCLKKLRAEGSSALTSRQH